MNARTLHASTRKTFRREHWLESALTGQITDTAGNLLGTIATAVTTPVTNLNGSCSILHLTLGPLDLDLLGLQVHLNQVVLDISAQPGSGNLLGNLLCSVANLLNNGSGLQQLTALLNQLLGALNVQPSVG